MQSIVALIALLAVTGSNADVDAKNRPVSKVITLLKDMVSQLEKEAEEDEEVYETMGCWCETNDKEKTKSIADGEQRIADLTALIEELTGASAKLNTEIANLEKEVAKNQGALDTATALRTKQLAEFNEEEKDMLQSISALKSAVITLSKHNAAMLQDSDDAYDEIVPLLHSELKKHKDLLWDVITPHQRKLLKTFDSPKAFVQNGASTGAPSSEIFGILKQMKETFETNLAASQREEMENQKAYEDLKAAKEEEIAAGQSQVDTKTVQLGNTDEKNAQSKEDLEDTQECLAADTAFLANLKERCASMDSEYEERTKTRQLEIQAVSKALAFLASDEAHDLFSRTLGFVQVSASSKRRDAVVKSLTNAAKKFNSPQLATLAVRARLDAFTKVKKSIEDMVDKLIKEKEDEIKHKDFCIEEINSNERDTEMKERDRDDLIAKIDDLAMTIDTLSKAIEVLKAEVAEMQVQMKRAGEDREKANKDFQMTVADQRATQKLLTAALGILKGFYEKAALISVNQHSEKQTTGQAPPPGFKSYEKNAASGGVMGMMSGIINDAKAMEAEAIRGEESAQKTYEEFVMDTNASIEEKVKDITAKTEAKAKAETAKVEATTERDDVLGELEQLANENADLHKSCDFTLKNFEIRQTARDEEVEALKQSIAMFSGASFSAFLSKV